jgi:hypothetical protein
MISFDNLVVGLNQYAVKMSKTINTLINTDLEWESDTSRFRPADYAHVERNMSIGDVLQPYQADIRAVKAATTFSGVETVLEDGMILCKFEQKELDQFTATQLYMWRQLGKELTAQDLYKLVMEQLIIPKVKENLNSVAFNGIGGGVTTAGTAGTMLKTFTGYNKRYTDAITAGKITPVPTGIPTNSNVDAKAKLMCQAVPSWLRFKPGKLKMSKSLRQAFIERMIADNKYTYSPQLGEDKYAIVAGFNKSIIGYDSMEGSNRMILELDEFPSQLIVTDSNLPMLPTLRVHQFDMFTMHVYAPIRRGYGLSYYETTFVNDAL